MVFHRGKDRGKSNNVCFKFGNLIFIIRIRNGLIYDTMIHFEIQTIQQWRIKFYKYIMVWCTSKGMKNNG